MSNIEELLHAKQERIDELHRLRPGQTALVVIDMQRGFLDPGAALEVPAGRDIVPNLKRLVDACRRRGVPVVFTEFVYSTAVPCLRGDPFGPEHLPAVEGHPTGFGYPSDNCLIAPHAAEGPDSADTIPELAPRPDELIVRGHAYDKFLGTPLDLALRTRGIRYLVLTGVVTDICVNSTLLTAANLDYRVTAVTDGVATLWPEIQRACFDIWRRKFARLRTTDEVLQEILAL
jgi:ureidoacrylate peracid hydrolase